MKDLMKHILRAVLVAMLLLSVAATALAQDERSCSAVTVSGHWGYSETGTVYPPPTGAAVSYSSVGWFTLDSEGNYSGVRYASLGGSKPVAVKFAGKATMGPDCTATLEINFYDASGNVTSTAEKFVVFVDHERGARAIVTSAVTILPDGTKVNIPTVLTTDARKQTPNAEKLR